MVMVDFLLLLSWTENTEKVAFFVADVSRNVGVGKDTKDSISGRKIKILSNYKRIGLPK